MTTCTLCPTDAGDRYLCERDTITLAKRLDDLPVLYAELLQCLVPRRTTWGDIITTKGAAGPRSPLDEDVLDEITSHAMGEVVHSWRVDVQRVRWPQHSAPDPVDLAADCRWLAMELDWIAVAYPPVGDLAREVRALEHRSRAIVGDPAPSRQHIGVCVAVIDHRGTVCGAALTRLPGQTVRCRVCWTEYRTETDLLLLRHYQPRDSA